MSKTILLVRAIRGKGFLNLEVLRSIEDNILFQFFDIKCFNLAISRVGIKEGKVGQLFSSNISTYEQTNS